MSGLCRVLAVLAGGAALLALLLPLSRTADGAAVSILTQPSLLACALAALLLAGLQLTGRLARGWGDLALAAAAHLGAFLLLLGLREAAAPAGGFWYLLAAAWLLAWLLVERLCGYRLQATRAAQRAIDLVVPLLFGLWLLLLWELLVRGLNVPTVLLPPPSMIGARLAASTELLWADFRQTFLKAVLIGYALGCGAGALVALLVDRSPFLKRGLLPIGNLASALPIIGIAPIMVMWFGFDWPSKAAVVVVMTFFPMLVNMVAGLEAAGAMERDLMKTYAADYRQTVQKLRLPAALPFIFNALKINSTLALIGAIVAEFFGTPIVGMGFRISTEVGRMNVDMVWAEIAVAALAGSLFYGLLVLLERAVTFWHPSLRN